MTTHWCRQCRERKDPLDFDVHHGSGNLQPICRQCMNDNRRGSYVSEVGADEAIARRLRSASERLRRLERAMVRCTLPAAIPTDQRQVALAARPPCSSLVFGHRQLEHCREVHGLDAVPDGAFEMARQVRDSVEAA